MRSQRFLAVVLLELRLTCLHWSYLLLQVLWSGFIVATYLNDTLFSVQSMLFFVQGLLSLVALFMTGIQAGRVQRARFDMLEVALPTGVEVLFARWLSSIIASLGFLVAPLVVTALTAHHQYSLNFLPETLFVICLMVMFVTGLIWVVQYTVGIRRWMYPFFVVFWIGAGFIPNALGTDGVPFPGSTLFNFVLMDRGFSSSLWGNLQQGSRPQLFLLFYVGIVALFAGIIAWRTIRQRFYRRSWVAVGVTVIALALVLAAGGAYTADAYAATQFVVNETQRLNLREFTPVSELPYIATRYDVTFALEDTPRFEAVVEVMNRGETPLNQLDFSINHQFELTQVSLPFEQDGDVVTMRLDDSLQAGETQHITFEYQGELWMVDRQLGRVPEASVFIRPDGVHLTCDALWYPIAGRIIPNYTPYSETGIHKRHCLFDQPARFHLVIESSGGLTFTSNLVDEGERMTSDGTLFVELIGAAQLQTVTRQHLTIVGTPNRFEAIAAKIEMFFTPAYDHLRRFFPDAPPLKIMVLDVGTESFNGWSSYPASAESIFLRFAPRQLEWVNDYRYLGQPVVEGYFGTGYNTLMDSISYFVWVHFHARGDIEEMQHLLRVDVPMGFAYMPERLAPALALFDVYAAEGEQALIDLLRDIHANFDLLTTMTPDEVVQWIQAHD